MNLSLNLYFVGLETRQNLSFVRYLRFDYLKVYITLLHYKSYTTLLSLYSPHLESFLALQQSTNKIQKGRKNCSFKKSNAREIELYKLSYKIMICGHFHHSSYFQYHSKIIKGILQTMIDPLNLNCNKSLAYSVTFFLISYHSPSISFFAPSLLNFSSKLVQPQRHNRHEFRAMFSQLG